MKIENLLVALSIALLTTSCVSIRTHGRQVGAGMFVGSDTNDYTKVRSEFQTWIEGQGFRMASAPSALSEWAGNKLEGQEATWFVIEEPGETPYHLRVHMIDSQKTIYVEFDSHVVGTNAQYARVDDRIKHFHGVVIEWFKNRPEENIWSKEHLNETLDVWN